MMEGNGKQDEWIQSVSEISRLCFFTLFSYLKVQMFYLLQK